MAANVFPIWLGAPAVRSATAQIVTRAGQASGTIRAERLDFLDASRHVAAWKDLAGRALEPNLFFEPDFVIPAAQHFAVARRPFFVFVWRWSGEGETLIGLCPVQEGGRFPGRQTSVWQHDHGALGVPLLDRHFAAEALDSMIDHICRKSGSAPGLMFPYLIATGPVAALLRSRAMRLGAHLREFSRHERAVLPLHTGEEPLGDIPARRLKEWRRLGRKLAKEGKVTFRSAQTPEEVRAAAEYFLALESRGWKGEGGTAMLINASLAVFIRTQTRLMARENKCRILTLESNGQPIAMGIVLIGHGRAAFWKTAYDEAFGRFSPGVQLTLELSRALHEEGACVLIDSCAIADHPMIDRVWRARQVVADIFTAPSAAANSRFDVAGLREGLRRDMRARAKSLYYRVCRKRVS